MRLPGTNITAPGGRRGSDCNGGDGYSGGGATGSGGGSNGSDGGFYSGRGGRGTGEDIAGYELSHFTLSPGRGGYHSGSSRNRAGGGGGVLVEGDASGRHDGSHRDDIGEGYGGGGGSYSGRSGVILVEVKSIWNANSGGCQQTANSGGGGCQQLGHLAQRPLRS